MEAALCVAARITALKIRKLRGTLQLSHNRVRDFLRRMYTHSKSAHKWEVAGKKNKNVKKIIGNLRNEKKNHYLLCDVV